MDWVIMRCLEKQRDRRYESASALSRDLQRFLSDEPVEARPPSTWYRLSKFITRHRSGVAAAALVVVTLIGGIVGTTLGMFRAEAERDLKDAALVDARNAQGAERRAKEQAQTRLAQLAKANEILDSIFADLSPDAWSREGKPLQVLLGEKLDKAVEMLNAEAIGDPLTTASIQLTLGTSLSALGFADKAVVLLSRAWHTRKEALGADDPGTLTAANNLAMAYEAAGKLSIAQPLILETLQFREKRQGLKHPDTLKSMSNVAQMYLEHGAPELALPLFRRVLECDREREGETGFQTLKSTVNLAVAYTDAEQYEAGIPLLEESYHLLKERFGPEDFDTCRAMANLGACYRETGRIKEALPLLEEALRYQKAKLPPDHPWMLLCSANLASGYLGIGKKEEALALYQEGLRHHRSRLGPDHPKTYGAMSKLGYCWQVMGESKKAIQLYEVAHRGQAATRGEAHPLTVTTLVNLGVCYWREKQFDKSVPALEQALKLSNPSKTSPEKVLTLKANLGVNYRDAGRYEEAIRLLEEVYAGGRVPTLLVWVAPALQDTYLRSGRHEAGAALVRKALTNARKRLPPESSDLTAQLNAAAYQLMRAKAWSEAEALLRECLVIREKKESHLWTTSLSKSLLGGALLAQRKHAEAEPYLLQGYAGLKAQEDRIPQVERQHLLVVLKNLVELYTQLGKSTETKKWKSELNDSLRDVSSSK
jgi:eukaryotic-like serine/threonine-protein kinase